MEDNFWSVKHTNAGHGALYGPIITYVPHTSMHRMVLNEFKSILNQQDWQFVVRVIPQSLRVQI